MMDVQDKTITTAEALESYTVRLRALGVTDIKAPLDATWTLAPERQAESRDTLLDSPRLPLLHTRAGSQTTPPELLMTGTLGEGGMGLVKLARQMALEREVAVKTLRGEQQDPGAASVLLLEAMVTAILEHPNIIPIYTLGQSDEGAPLIVMKRIEGRSWRELLDAPQDTPEEYRDALEWHIHVLMQVCNAVHFAHSRGIIHRDLKPDNVMIGSFGEVYVLDWGIAVSMREEHVERFPMARDVSAPAGTPVYMSPEMASGVGAQLGVHTDVFLVGAMLHELVTGRPPHTGETLMQILFAAYRWEPPTYDESVPEGLARICRRAMAADPMQRYASVDALRKALAEFLLHRESTELAHQASQRLARLESICSAEVDSQVQSGNEAHQAYVEGRFGFEQALRVWPDNERARQERRRLVELMVGFELERQNLGAAATLLAELAEPPPELTARLKALRDEAAQKESEYTNLRQEQFDNDFNVGARKRSRFFAFMGVCMLGPIFPRFVPGLEFLIVEFDTATYLALLIPYGLLIALGSYVGRKTFLRHAANRRAMSAFYMTFVVIALHRFQSWYVDTPPLQALAHELLFLTLGLALLAVIIDRRIMAATVAFLLAFFVSTLEPDWAFEIFGVAGAIGLFVLAAVSRPSQHAS